MRVRVKDTIIDLGSITCPYLNKNTESSVSEAVEITKEHVVAPWSSLCALRWNLLGTGRGKTCAGWVHKWHHRSKLYIMPLSWQKQIRRPFGCSDNYEGACRCNLEQFLCTKVHSLRCGLGSILPSSIYVPCNVRILAKMQVALRKCLCCWLDGG